ncbi:MAG: prenyltransferase/squalene oxidase repeat-containing protein [Planctomycetota bacterium]|jgi:hypothetical protein
MSLTGKLHFRTNSRRSLVFVLFLLTTCWGLLIAGEPSGGGTAKIIQAKESPELKKETLDAIEKGLDFLARIQDLEGPGATGEISEAGRYPVACTALAGLAFLASGSTYNRGPYGANVKACLDYFLNKGVQVQLKKGYFQDSNSQSRMHGHGFATMFLAEVYGSLPPGDAKDAFEAIRKAIKVIVDAQTRKGGWYYHPKDQASADTRNLDEASITITMVQALRAARNAGFYVKKGTINNAIQYVRQSATPRGFRYSLTMDRARNRRSYELTAGAVAVLHASGIYADSKELVMGLKYMRDMIAAADAPTRAAGHNRMFYYYGNFYAAQVMFQIGGEDWKQFYEDGFNELISRQTRDGAWGAQVMWSRPYATAVACLILQMPFRYLPIFQR